MRAVDGRFFSAQTPSTKILQEGVGSEGPNRRHGLFHDFDYHPSRYCLEEELKERQRMNSHSKMHRISGRPFICSSTFKIGKYENISNGKGLQYHYTGGTYESQQTDADEKWKKRRSQLHGPFVHSPKYSDAKCARSAMLSRYARRLARHVSSDWPNVRCVQMKSDMLMLCFPRSSLSETEVHALLPYMNTLASCNQIVHDAGLEKMREKWNYMQRGDDKESEYCDGEDHLICFVLRTRRPRAPKHNN